MVSVNVSVSVNDIETPLSRIAHLPTHLLLSAISKTAQPSQPSQHHLNTISVSFIPTPKPYLG